MHRAQYKERALEDCQRYLADNTLWWTAIPELRETMKAMLRGEIEV